MINKKKIKLRPGRAEGLNYATLSVTVTPEQYAFIRQHVNASDYHRALLDTLMKLAELHSERRKQRERYDELTGVSTGELGRYFKSKETRDDEFGNPIYEPPALELDNDGNPIPFSYTQEEKEEGKVRFIC